VTTDAARFAIAFIAAASAVMLSGPAAHADEGWVVTSFQSDINVGADSMLTVKEDIRVDFGNLQKHGIFRTIPLRYRYAIVFSCVTIWAKAFEGIDTSANTKWYVGTGPFQAALLASSLQSMNANISSAISITPPSSGSSSGFGGGGFSGGGGGGGGGGSW
jgi:uncharacterized membrane protein YgcG